MEKNEQLYLEQLIEWGDHVKSLLTNEDFPDDEQNLWLKQLDDWQGKISKVLADENRNTDDHDPTVTQLKTEGEQLVAQIKEQTNRMEIKSIPYGHHQLPPLPYKYDALEPYISEEIMRLHHNKHHQSYVEGLNKAEKALYTKKKGQDPIKHWLREQAFNGSGHYLHTIFWYNMTPKSRKKPSGSLLQQIEKDFGSWKQFKKLFSKAANSAEGVGWAILLWAPRSHRLCIQTYEKHQMFQLADTIPLLVLDVWEHAYYLQYQTDKELYIENWWNVVNWVDVNERYDEAKKVKWVMF